MRTLVIIPAYNEAENIERTVDDLVNNVPDVNVMIINDCSIDKTKDILKENDFFTFSSSFL